VPFHGVCAGREVLAMNLAQHVGPGVVQNLVASLEAEKVVESEVGVLEHRAHCSVADDNAT
jgi:hypothetical protein